MADRVETIPFSDLHLAPNERVESAEVKGDNVIVTIVQKDVGRDPVQAGLDYLSFTKQIREENQPIDWERFRDEADARTRAILFDDIEE